ncbi:hypothetical protein RHEC894_PC00410 (plasmid) [Rhizobium sp. CIAT894]|nr:hypothetical protein Bra5_PB00193 [Rhizobium phaseoli Brasil 5]ARM91431.1 hypothetical protein RHEC894_PC00410 [Rhizobium sp. CIAT894]EGE56165.1 hypothetical protein RHECNPAF_7480022 [Rhizobium etli CNPAF512]
MMGRTVPEMRTGDLVIANNPYASNILNRLISSSRERRRKSPASHDNRLGPLAGTVELEFYLCCEWVSSKQSILRIEWRDPLDEHLDGNQVVDGAPSGVEGSNVWLWNVMLA